VLREERGSLARRDVERTAQRVTSRLTVAAAFFASSRCRWYRSRAAVVTFIAGRAAKNARTGFRWQRILSTEARPWFSMCTISASAS
jgi:hypothetical protein